MSIALLQCQKSSTDRQVEPNIIRIVPTRPALGEVLVYPYRCCRHYPEGVTRASQAARILKLSAISWVLGINYRHVAAVLALVGKNWVFDWQPEVS